MTRLLRNARTSLSVRHIALLAVLALAIPASTVAAHRSGATTTDIKATSWQMTETGMASFNTVSCANSHYCAAIGSTQGIDDVVTFNGKGWGVLHQLEQYKGEVTSLSCPSAGWCVAITDLLAVTVLQAGHWTKLTTIDPNPGPPYPGIVAGVSCVTRHFCVAVDGQGNAESYDGTSWKQPILIDADYPVNGISCGSVDSCVAVDGAGSVIRLQHGKWSSPMVIDDTALTGVSCATDRFCVAVDLLGRVLLYQGTTWSPPMTKDQTAAGPLSVSCPETGRCIFVDGRGRVLVLQSGRWTSSRAVLPGLVDVACPVGVSTLCVAVDSGGEAYSTTEAFPSHG